MQFLLTLPRLNILQNKHTTIVTTPTIFGIIVNGSGYTPAFIFGGIACVVFAVIGFAAREPKRVSATASEPIASLEGAFEPHLQREL